MYVKWDWNEFTGEDKLDSRVFIRAGQMGPPRPEPANPWARKGQRAGQTGLHGLTSWDKRFVLVYCGRFWVEELAPSVPETRPYTVWCLPALINISLYSSDKSHPMKILQTNYLRPTKHDTCQFYFILLPFPIVIFSLFQSSKFIHSFIPFLSLSHEPSSSSLLCYLLHFHLPSNDRNSHQTSI